MAAPTTRRLELARPDGRARVQRQPRAPGRRRHGADRSRPAEREDRRQEVAKLIARLRQDAAEGPLDSRRLLGSRVVAGQDAADARADRRASRPTTRCSCSGSTATWALANTVALTLAGVTRDTPAPEGGAIVKDAAGEPTGILKDNAVDLVTRLVPPATLDETMAKARAGAAARGLGRRHDRPGHDRQRRSSCARTSSCARGRAARRGSLRTRTTADRRPGRGRRDDGLRRRLAAHRRHQAVRRRLDGLGHGRLLRALRGRPDDVGPADPVAGGAGEEGVRRRRRRLPGRSCTRSAIAPTPSCSTSSRSCSRPAGARDRRPRIEHAQVVRDADKPRFAKAGVIASIQPSHCIDDMRWAEKRIGPERVQDRVRLQVVRRRRRAHRVRHRLVRRADEPDARASTPRSRASFPTARRRAAGSPRSA